MRERESVRETERKRNMWGKILIFDESNSSKRILAVIYKKNRNKKKQDGHVKQYSKICKYLCLFHCGLYVPSESIFENACQIEEKSEKMWCHTIL